MSMLKVLVADDSRTIRIQLTQILSKAGYEVVTASDGRQAVDQIISESPFLVILDINMPELDGYGVCQAMKSMADPWQQLPVIFLTTLRSHALELLGRELGAYLQKPVNPAELLEVVEVFAHEFVGG